jgi:hypothetical protein
MQRQGNVQGLEAFHEVVIGREAEKDVPGKGE